MKKISFEDLGSMFNIIPDYDNSEIRVGYEDLIDKKMDYISGLEPGVYSSESFENTPGGGYDSNDKYIQDIFITGSVKIHKLKWDFTPAVEYAHEEYRVGSENLNNICKFYEIEFPDITRVKKYFSTEKCINHGNPELVRNFMVDNIPVGKKVSELPKYFVVLNGLSGNTWRWFPVDKSIVQITYKPGIKVYTSVLNKTFEEIIKEKYIN